MLDWQYDGLKETLSTLKSANIKYSGRWFILKFNLRFSNLIMIGAGLNKTEAETPAVLPHPRDQNKRVFQLESSSFRFWHLHLAPNRAECHIFGEQKITGLEYKIFLTS